MTTTSPFLAHLDDSSVPLEMRDIINDLTAIGTDDVDVKVYQPPARAEHIWYVLVSARQPVDRSTSTERSRLWARVSDPGIATYRVVLTISANEAKPVPQDVPLSTYGPPITHRDYWRRRREIVDLVRSEVSDIRQRRREHIEAFEAAARDDAGVARREFGQSHPQAARLARIADALADTPDAAEARRIADEYDPAERAEGRLKKLKRLAIANGVWREGLGLA